MPVLFAFREDRFGFQFEIGERALLGRSPECELILFDRAASRHHAEIYQAEEGYILKDLGSTNGTMHNEVRLEGEILLKTNDSIRVGQEVFLFDPSLDAAVGPEGAVLIVGDVESEPEGALAGSPEPDLSSMDRNILAPLYQVSSALSNRPKKSRVLKQVAYAITKLFSASHIALLWPETTETNRLTALISRPKDQRLILPRPLVELVVNEHQAVIWPHVITKLDFDNGERILEQSQQSCMATPLVAHGDLVGLCFVSSPNKTYTAKELNFFNALAALIASALINASLIGQLEHRLTRDEENLDSGEDFIGEDNQIKALLGTAYQVGQTDARILLTGEAGTGKEVLGRRIHAQSPRRRGPYISLNCSTLAASQVESALFGQEAGAMSEEGQPGLLEQADGGTLFIRHIDHLSLAAQVQFLRSLEEGVVYRVGSSIPRPINIRIISSTIRDLAHMVEEGEFREDLYMRLSEVVLTMPPLREIKEDVPILARYFLSRRARESGAPVPELDDAAAACLQSYPWPGNVGELKNLTDRLIMYLGSDRVVLDDLPAEIRFSSEAFMSFTGEAESETLAEVERVLIRRCLGRSNGDTGLAAEMLGISQKEITELIERYNIYFD